MAFDPTYRDINSLFAGWTEDGTNITLPIASLPELTAAEADATTGDSRKVIFAIMERLRIWFRDLAAADRPTKITVTRSDFSDPSNDTITYTYAIQIVTEATGVEVVAE